MGAGMEATVDNKKILSALLMCQGKASVRDERGDAVVFRS